jgi:hypothetical protein
LSAGQPSAALNDLETKSEAGSPPAHSELQEELLAHEPMLKFVFNNYPHFSYSVLVDEFTIHYSPVFFGQGLPLFSGMSKGIDVKIKEAVASKEVTHVTYQVER